MSKSAKHDEVDHPRAIAAIVEGVINEFGESGLDRLCFFQICTPFVRHIEDPQYLSEYELWVSVVCEVCSRRGIAFDAKATCENFTDRLWTRELGIRLD